MPKFRKRQIVIEAEQFREEGDNAEDIIKWALKYLPEEPMDPKNPVFIKQEMVDAESNTCIHQIAINTLEGTMVADAGDWIIRGTKGELYPCKADIFEQIYEPLVLIN